LFSPECLAPGLFPDLESRHGGIPDFTDLGGIIKVRTGIAVPHQLCPAPNSRYTIGTRIRDTTVEKSSPETMVTASG